jgi:AcrR family transcriptional regulator
VPPRPGLTLEKLLDAAVEIIERDGADALSLTSLAKHFKVKPPSLYNHVAGLKDLRRALRLRGLRELGASLQRAAMGRAGRDALLAIARAYRDYAKNNPALYALTLRSTEGDDDELRQAEHQVLEVVLAVLHGYELAGEDAIHATRILRSALHGFVTLEAAGGYALPVSTEETYERLLLLLHAGLRQGFRADTVQDAVSTLLHGAASMKGEA